MRQLQGRHEAGSQKPVRHQQPKHDDDTETEHTRGGALPKTNMMSSCEHDAVKWEKRLSWQTTGV